MVWPSVKNNVSLCPVCILSFAAPPIQSQFRAEAEPEPGYSGLFPRAWHTPHLGL